MDAQLKLLISFFEKEKDQLQVLIDKCIEDTEYLMAHYYSQALYQLNRRLQTLNNIDDKLYDEKNHKLRRINEFEKQIETEIPDLLKEYYKKHLERTRKELEDLNEITKRTLPSGNIIIFDETLKKLVEKKIKHLKLILKKSDNLFLSFSYSNKVLKVTLPHVKEHTKKLILFNDNINQFINLGFRLTENGTRLSLTLAGNKEEIFTKLKITLSKIVFEIFYFREFDNESYIQFTDKKSR